MGFASLSESVQRILGGGMSCSEPSCEFIECGRISVQALLQGVRRSVGEVFWRLGSEFSGRAVAHESA